LPREPVTIWQDNPRYEGDSPAHQRDDTDDSSKDCCFIHEEKLFAKIAIFSFMEEGMGKKIFFNHY
jgi:hypothetical protein